MTATLLATKAAAADEPALPDGVVAVLKGHTEIVSAIAFSPDGKQVLTGSFDKTIKLWETTTGKEIKTFGGRVGHQNLVLSVAFSSDGHTLASGASDNTAKLCTRRVLVQLSASWPHFEYFLKVSDHVMRRPSVSHFWTG